MTIQQDRQRKSIEFMMNSKTNPVLEDLGVLKIVTYDSVRKNKQYPALMVFLGNSSKPAKHFFYHSIEERDKSIKESIKMSYDRQLHKENVKENRKSFVHTLKVNDIMVCSWGYDQTNIDFYQVVGVKNKRVTLREIGGKMSHRDGCSPMSGYTIPTPNDFIGEPFEKLVTVNNGIKLSSYQWASVWSGEPKYVSWYA